MSYNKQESRKKSHEIKQLDLLDLIDSHSAGSDHAVVQSISGQTKPGSPKLREPHDIAIRAAARKTYDRPTRTTSGWPYNSKALADTSAEMMNKFNMNDASKRVLKAFELHGPMTSAECSHAMGMGLLSVRPPMTILKNQGYLQDTGYRRKNDSNNTEKVLEITQKGKDEIKK